MKKLITIAIAAVLLLGVNTTFSQNKKADKKASEKQLVRNKIDSTDFTFTANFISPVRGGQRLLVGAYYDLKITKDTIKAFLPYQGRVYNNPPLNAEDNSIKFTSTNFDYKVTPKKKGGWMITIKFNDTQKANQMTLDVSENGYASLVTISTNRDPVNFTGDINTVRDKKG